MQKPTGRARKPADATEPRGTAPKPTPPPPGPPAATEKVETKPAPDLYRNPARCSICGRDFLARYNVPSHLAKTCTPPGHVCQRKRITLPDGRRALSRCLEDCCRSQYVAGAPKQFLSGTLERRKYFETHEALKQVLEHLKDIPAKYRLHIRFIAACGLRVKESLLVRVSDCALDDAIPSVMVPTLKRKGRPLRRIDLDADLAKDLRRWIAGWKLGTNDYLFRCSKRSVQRWWAKLQQAAGAKLVRGVHSLRHSHFTRLAELGVDPKYSQSRAGWSSISMYSVYAHVTDAMRKAVTSKLPKV